MSLRSGVYRIDDKTGGCEQRILIFAFHEDLCKGKGREEKCNKPKPCA